MATTTRQLSNLLLAIVAASSAISSACHPDNRLGNAAFNANPINSKLAEEPDRSEATVVPADLMANGIRAILGGDFEKHTAIEQEISLYDSPTKESAIIRQASELDCSDWKRCRWHNTRSDELGDWLIANGKADARRWNYISNVNVQPEQSYLITGAQQQRPLGNQRIMLLSDAIQCQNGPGRLQFKNWISPFTELIVCKKLQSDITFENLLNCAPPLNRDSNPGPNTVKIAAEKQPFQIVFIATNFTYRDQYGQGGLVGLDDVTYSANLCEPSLDANSVEVPSQETKNLIARDRSSLLIQSSEQQACKVFPCNFENKDSLCFRGSKRKNFKRGQGMQGIRLTGIPGDSSNRKDGWYIWAQGPSNAVFETPVFQINNNADLKLRFDLFDNTYNTQLWACSQAARNANESDCQFNNADWRYDTTTFRSGSSWITSESNDLPIRNLPLKTGPQKVIIKANFFAKRLAYAALDNLELVDSQGAKVRC